MRATFVSIALLTLVAVMTSHAQQTNPVTPRDCVQVRYLLDDDSMRSPIQVNPQGTAVAYLVKSPNLAKNTNDIDLYSVALDSRQTSKPALLTHGEGISQLQWLDEGRQLAFLIKRAGRVVVAAEDFASRRIETLARLDGDITEYSISHDGDVLVAAIDKPKQEQGQIVHTAEEIVHGYQVPFQTNYLFGHPEKLIYLFRRQSGGQYGPPRRLVVTSPFTGEPVAELFSVLNLRLSLSPDGRRLAITYLEHGANVPAAWRTSANVRGILERVNEVQITAVVDLATGTTTIPLKTPWPYSVPLWSSDSRKFIEIADPPENSPWDSKDQQPRQATIQMFSVDVASGQAQQIEDHVYHPTSQPLRWAPNGDLILADKQHFILHLRDSGKGWGVRSRFEVPLPDGCYQTSIASDGITVVTDCQSATKPPELLAYSKDQRQPRTIARLDPQLDGLSLAPSREVRWKTSTGYEATGLLILPLGYHQGDRYPLVVQTYPVYHGGFVCDSGESHDPASAPQPLANAGIMYLLRSRAGMESQAPDSEYYPQGYPGGIGEAVFQMDLADDAVKKLSEEGLVDPSKVGIIGFSRSGWYVGFTLAHSPIRYAAATISDGSHLTLGDYWLQHSERTIGVSDALFGGPPYGASLEAWLQYSISFNLDNVHTPLMIEVMGYGVPYANINTPPLYLATYFEELTGLNRLRRPVELYYYPNEQHQPDHPQARLANLQRNLDWYRFWLQGYERPRPEDPDQYKRWEHLRELRDADAKATGQAQDNASKPN
jgi:dipeptidyl aminopeptidase/acylaminoacyl peptidase